MPRYCGSKNTTLIEPLAGCRIKSIPSILFLKFGFTVQETTFGAQPIALSNFPGRVSEIRTHDPLHPMQVRYPGCAMTRSSHQGDRFLRSKSSVFAPKLRLRSEICANSSESKFFLCLPVFCLIIVCFSWSLEELLAPNETYISYRICFVFL